MVFSSFSPAILAGKIVGEIDFAVGNQYQRPLIHRLGNPPIPMQDSSLDKSVSMSGVRNYIQYKYMNR